MTINTDSLEWVEIKKLAATKIEDHRLELEALDVAADAAQQLRGRIAALRDLILIVEPTPRPDVKDTNYG